MRRRRMGVVTFEWDARVRLIRWKRRRRGSGIGSGSGSGSEKGSGSGSGSGRGGVFNSKKEWLRDELVFNKILQFLVDYEHSAERREIGPLLTFAQGRRGAN